MKDIDILIQNSLEVKRALAVKMILTGYSITQIEELLNVSKAFIEKWRALYNKEGVSCFPVAYKGSDGFLNQKQTNEVLQFINSKQTCMLEELISYIQVNFGIQYKSKQSYYDFLYKGGMGWKKTEKTNPKKDDNKVELKKEELKKTSVKEKKRYFPGIWSY